jgi:hypothetical protein
MEINVAYLIVLLAVIARLFASAGWKLTPAIDEKTGKFQLNVIFIVLVSFVSAVPVLQSINLVGDPVYVAITIFMAVYGAPAVVDKVGTAITPTPVTEDQVTEEEPSE